MNDKLAALCLGFWSLGLLEMGAARGLFGLQPGEIWFDAGTALSLAGGAGYCFLAGMAFLGLGKRSS